MIISTTDLTKACNVSRQAIAKLNLPKVDRGKYDTDNQEIKNYLLSKGVNLGQFKNKVSTQSKKTKDKPNKPTPKSKPEPKKQPVKKQIKQPVKLKLKKPKKQTESKPKKKLSTSKVIVPAEEDNGPKIITPFVPTQDFSNEDFEDITGLPESMMNLTLFHLVKRYGGPKQLTDWANILSKLMTAQKADISIQRERLALIEKDYTISQVFKFLDVFVNQIFDLAESQAEQIIGFVKSDHDKAKKNIIELQRKGYSKIAKETKRSINSAIKRLKDKYNATDIDE